MGTMKAPIGRPRGFDADAALGRAMAVFWEQGYEGASLADLTAAMGITKTSMYAAFGNKEDLFRKVLERYEQGPAAYVARALRQPTAREVATTFLAYFGRHEHPPRRPGRLPERPGLTGRRMRPGGRPATSSPPGATGAAYTCATGSGGPSTTATCPRMPIRSCSPGTS